MLDPTTTTPPTLPDDAEVSDEAPGSSGRFRLPARSDEDRVVAGVAGGLAARLGVDAVYVRAALVVLAFAAGIGLVLYLILWGLTADREPVGESRDPVTGREAFGLAVGFLGALLVLRSVGMWFGDSVVWPAGLVSFGVAVSWDRMGIDSAGRLGRLTQSDGEIGSPGRIRIVIGGILMLAGAGAFLGRAEQFENLGTVLLAVMVTTLGFVLVFGPWVRQLLTDLGRERRERIRQEERAEFAAHLHDSVLQTLALIQRSDDSKRMVTLARAQERELREWLYGVDQGSDEAVTLASAVRAVASRVEGDHDVPVEVVAVGDTALDDGGRAMVQAAAEAMTNAARHSGAGKVSVYVEVTGGAAEVFVSDQGSGFDPAGVPIDRRGIADSIVGRMQRHGGSASVASDPVDGTEVHLTLPRAAS